MNDQPAQRNIEHEVTPTALLNLVADAVDAALDAADEAGLYDDLATFPAARARVAAELLDRLRAEGYALAPTCTCREPDCYDTVHDAATFPGANVALLLAAATAARDADEL